MNLKDLYQIYNLDRDKLKPILAKAIRKQHPVLEHANDDAVVFLFEEMELDASKQKMLIAILEDTVRYSKVWAFS